MGAICVTSSAFGTDMTSANTNGIFLLTHLTEVGTKLELCLPWYDALCLTGAGISISEDISLDDSIFKKNSADYLTPCTNLKNAYNCGTSCDERKRVLIEDM